VTASPSAAGRLGLALPLGRLALRGWPVAAKLGAVLVVPVAIALLLGGLRIGASLDSAGAYDRVGRLAALGGRAAEVGHDLQTERDLAAAYVAGGRGPVSTQLTGQQSQVDRGAEDFRTAAAGIDDRYGAVVRARVAAVLNRLDNLGALRELTLSTGLPASAVISTYTNVVTDVLDLESVISEGSVDAALNGTVRAFSALSIEKELVSRQRAMLAVALAAGRFAPGGYEEFLATSAQVNAANRDFIASATAGQGQRYKDTVTGQRVDRAEQIVEIALARADQPALGISAGEWLQAISAKVALIRQVEQTLISEVLDRSGSLRSAERERALWSSASVLLGLLLALAVSFLVARSMLRSLRSLRSSAQDIADRRLPDVIERMRQGEIAPDDTVEPVARRSGDEIGEVARAFDAVHSQAVRLAAEQAGIRANVNSMFVNLSRRSQGLVERQLALIDELETGEQDPDQLANLFKLDHLATRMRRNSENLLVLAGEDAGRRWGHPVPLLDVLRAASSEVEQYDRIQLTGVPEVEVMGHAVNHLVHLVAELLENATVYSPPRSPVTVLGQRLSGGGALIEIIDRGLGIREEDLVEVNERLANPPVFDVSLSRMMGLYVVGRLASRHNIVVRLRSSESGGLAAFVRLPAATLTSPELRWQEAERRTTSGAAYTRLGDVPAEAGTSLSPVGPVRAFGRTRLVDAGGAGVPTPPLPLSPPWPPSPPLPPTPPLPALPALPQAPGGAGGGTPDGRPPTGLKGWFGEPWSPAEPPGEPAGVVSRLAAPVAETTPAGLPRRMPSAHLVPGAYSDGKPASPQRSAEEIRRRVADYQDGVRRARPPAGE
jgi:signal transduction histidine kinase